MDSFRPGSSSYCPFQNQDQDQSIIVNRIDDAREANADQIQTVDTVPDNITDSEDDQESTESSDENREEENRRQLYLPSGRPRPFYRVYSTSPQTSLLEDAGTITQSRIPSSNNKKRPIRSLQETVRNYFVATFGLVELSRIVKKQELFPQLPSCIKYFLLTFPCTDFEEIGSERPACAASYHVRCKLDGQKYTAIFAVSEMDKASYNVWKDKEDWLDVIDGVQEIFATCVDAMTENIFYIIDEPGVTLGGIIKDNDESLNEALGLNEDNLIEDAVEIVGKTIHATLKNLQERSLHYAVITKDTILLQNKNIYLQNPLLLKSHKDIPQPNISEVLHSLARILEDLLHCDTIDSLTDDMEDIDGNFMFHTTNKNHPVYAFISETLKNQKFIKREM